MEIGIRMYYKCTIMYSHCRHTAINVIEESAIGIVCALLPIATDMMCTVSIISLASDGEPSGTDRPL